MKKFYHVFLMITLLFLVSCNTKETSLKEEDFDVSYKGVVINDQVTPIEIIDKLGFGLGYEENNNGLISQGNGYNRWALHYPGKEETEISIVYLEDLLVNVNLLKVPTKRGIKAGDTITELEEKYGKGISKTEGNLTAILYQFDHKELCFYLNENETAINRILIDYNLDEANNKQGFTKGK